MLWDIRHAIRSWLRTPGVALVALLSLTLGIGANTIAFSLVNSLQFRPLPYVEPDRLVDVHETSGTELCAGCGVGTSWPGYLEWRESARSFKSTGAYTDEAFAIAGVDGPPQRVAGGRLTASLLTTLGVRAVRGRLFTEADDRPGAEPVAIIGHDLWTTRFGADTGVVGRTIRISGSPHTIVGIMPRRFGIPEFASLWLPLAPPADWPRSERSLGVIARLAPGVTLAQVSAEMAGIGARQAAANPATNAAWSAGVRSLHADLASETLPFSLLLMSAVAFVLLIACANLAGLLLVRATTRRREIAVRLALGAGRRRIVRQLLAESLVISLLGGLMGLWLSVLGTRLAVAAIGTTVPAWIQFGLDGRVLIFCLLTSVATGVGFGLAPAVEASRPDVQATLKDGGGASDSRRGGRLRGAFVVVQLALALVLLIGAGLMVKTLVRTNTQDPGYEIAGLARADVDLLGARYRDAAQVPLFAQQVRERLGGIPGISAAFSLDEFIAGFGGQDRRIALAEGTTVPDGASPRFATVISDGYFTTLGLRIVAGRDITADESRRGGDVAIVSEGMASRIWPGKSPIGRRIKLGPADSTLLPWLTVIGVAADAGSDERAGSRSSAVYVPLSVSTRTSLTLHVRSAMTIEALAPVIRAAVRDVDADQPVENLMTEEQALVRWGAPSRFVAIIMGTLAAIALLLASIGIYGVTAFSVASRTREIGIRMALGATGAEVQRMVLRGAARLAILAVAIGVVGALGFSQILRAVLFGTSPTDPLVFTGVSALLFGVALTASWLPARRAARVDPTQALRAE